MTMDWGLHEKGSTDGGVMGKTICIAAPPECGMVGWPSPSYFSLFDQVRVVD